MSWIVLGAFLWAGGWCLNIWLARKNLGPRMRLLIPIIFGFTLIAIWECAVRGFEVSAVLLPAPSAVAARFAASTDILWEDFVQTVLKGALSGYVIGCGAAFLVAIGIDRSDFLKRGLLPVGNFVAALPIVGMAFWLCGSALTGSPKLPLSLLWSFSRCS